MQFDVRLDHQFTKHNQIFGRYSYMRDFATPVTPLPDGSGNITSGILAPGTTAGHSIAVSYLHEINPILSNEGRGWDWHIASLTRP